MLLNFLNKYDGSKEFYSTTYFNNMTIDEIQQRLYSLNRYGIYSFINDPLLAPQNQLSHSASESYYNDPYNKITRSLLPFSTPQGSGSSSGSGSGSGTFAQSDILTPDFIRNLYISNILLFTPKEIAIITKYFNLIIPMIKSKCPDLYKLLSSLKSISFIKMTSGFDWNYPYTINKCIVLSEQFLKHLLSTSVLTPDNDPRSHEKWNIYRISTATMLENATTLCHEVFHIIQRYYKKYFIPIYTYWGYRHTGNSLFLNNSFISLTNPDGHNYEYILFLNGKFYLPFLSFSLQNKPLSVLLEIIPLSTKSAFQILPSFNLLSHSKFVISHFADVPSYNLYHPNELFAFIMSSYIIKSITYQSNLFIPLYRKFTLP